MTKDESTKRDKLMWVMIEELVPQDHPLRKIEKAIDFSFIRERMRPFYSKNKGRPAIDPVVLFKMLLIGYMFDIPSERKLVKEIEVNFAYRWFLHLDFLDKAPHHSTIRQNRRHRCKGTDVFQQTFKELVEKVSELGFVGGKYYYTDFERMKAENEKLTVEESTQAYLDGLDQPEKENRTTAGWLRI
ncbi:MAG TPA: transposase [Candidatus Cloacimonadota bacterium]|nr:transposase [Candidatus Cloacimonadota bacterium]